RRGTGRGSLRLATTREHALEPAPLSHVLAGDQEVRMVVRTESPGGEADLAPAKAGCGNRRQRGGAGCGGAGEKILDLGSRDQGGQHGLIVVASEALGFAIKIDQLGITIRNDYRPGQGIKS